MEDLRFVSGLVDAFFDNQTIKKKLKRIREKGVTGWEKWAQVEFGLFLYDRLNVKQADREWKFEVDHRKSDQSKAFVDFVLRKKNCTKDLFLGVELKQHDSFATCLSRMLDDLDKINTLKGKTLRDCFHLGIHDRADEDHVIDRVLVRCSLPSRQRIISQPIGRTG